MLETILYIILAINLAAAGVVYARMSRAKKMFRIKQLLTDSGMLDELPTVSVCIPVRNEDRAMTECLQSVLSSNYPKLEVIVLDDQSRDDTPALIRSFAQDGVRFVEGGSLPSGWVGKNHALEMLMQEASGEYILYLDIGTRLSPDSIEQLVAYARQENAAMLSVLPRRVGERTVDVAFSTLRYFWEVMFHRGESPATASAAWMIDREVLSGELSGFSGVKERIQPESHFSSKLMRDGRYRFLLGTDELGITNGKSIKGQRATSIRLLFPLLGAKASHSIIAILDLLIMAGPLWVILSGFVMGFGLMQALAGLVWLAAGFTYFSFSALVWRQHAWLAFVVWPLVLIQEAILIALSTLGYIRGAIMWKGRTVKARA